MKIPCTLFVQIIPEAFLLTHKSYFSLFHQLYTDIVQIHIVCIYFTIYMNINMLCVSCWCYASDVDADGDSDSDSEQRCQRQRRRRSLKLHKSKEKHFSVFWSSSRNFTFVFFLFFLVHFYFLNFYFVVVVVIVDWCRRCFCWYCWHFVRMFQAFNNFFFMFFFLPYRQETDIVHAHRKMYIDFCFSVFFLRRGREAKTFIGIFQIADDDDDTRQRIKWGWPKKMKNMEPK